MWTRIDEERRLCELWLKDPLINPDTGHPIDRNGPTYNNWIERCKKLGMKHRPLATREMTWRKCEAWRENPSLNPDSGRKIKIGGKIYKEIQKQCNIINKEIKLEGDYYIPDKSGLVPTIIYRSTIYVVRKLNNRKVWGPLNKPAKNIRLRYYKDTWDYRYNHYKPIFQQEPKRPDSKIKKRAIKKTENPKYVVDGIINLFIE